MLHHQQGRSKEKLPCRSTNDNFSLDLPCWWCSTPKYRIQTFCTSFSSRFLANKILWKLKQPKKYVPTSGNYFDLPELLEIELTVLPAHSFIIQSISCVCQTVWFTRNNEVHHQSSAYFSLESTPRTRLRNMPGIVALSHMIFSMIEHNVYRCRSLLGVLFMNKKKRKRKNQWNPGVSNYVSGCKV